MIRMQVGQGLTLHVAAHREHSQGLLCRFAFILRPASSIIHKGSTRFFAHGVCHGRISALVHCHLIRHARNDILLVSSDLGPRALLDLQPVLPLCLLRCVNLERLVMDDHCLLHQLLDLPQLSVGVLFLPRPLAQ